MCQQLGRNRSGSTRGLFSSSLVLQKLSAEIHHEECALSFLSTTWNIVPFFMWHFFNVQVSRCLYLSWIQPLVLRLKSCCVCEGGDDDSGVGEVLYSWLRVMVWKKEAILTFRRDKAPLSFSPTHDWVACRSVPLSAFSFTLKHYERDDSSVQSGRPLPPASCTLRKRLSANDISNKRKKRKKKT